jgi:Fur family ferric uptake transcriptional regulator
MTHCDSVIDTLSQRGYRITPQREMVVEAICGEQHTTAEQIFANVQLRTKAVNIATVYRTLELLVEEGLATRADLGGDRIVYATVHHGPHIHLVCRTCGEVLDVELEAFQSLFEDLQDQFGFTCGSQHLAVHGLCENCHPGTGDSNADADEV